MTVLKNLLTSKMNIMLNNIVKVNILLVALLLLSFNAFSQTTVVGWDFNDGDNIADSGVPGNINIQTTIAVINGLPIPILSKSIYRTTAYVGVATTNNVRKYI